MLRKLLPAVLALSCFTVCVAQIAPGPSRVYGSDTDVPTPKHSESSQSDSTAIQVLIEFVKATGLVGWQGMTASGTITLAGDSTPHSATLSVLGGDKYRLDVTRDTGVDSTVLNGSQGLFISANGTRALLSSDVATLGLIAFPRLLAPAYPASNTILTDRGTLTVSGVNAHRITLDDPATDTLGSAWKTIDLYFDPLTKRVTGSMAAVRLSTSDAALYTLATTYSDYRPTGLATLPYAYTQSLNGQLQWTLQLASIDTAKIPNAALFNF